MANKYVDVSATYNGDGTTSAQAGSAGAAGAWNNLRNVVIGTPGYGSVVAGDNIYVRTKNGTDLGETWSSNTTGTSNGTTSAPINLIFDNGAIWDAGLFTITHTAASFTAGSQMNFMGNNSLKFYFDAATSRSAAIVFNSSTYRDFIVETETYNSINKWQQFTYVNSYIKNVTFNIYIANGGNYSVFRNNATFVHTNFYGCKFNGNPSTSAIYCWFNLSGFYPFTNVYGSSWSGTKNTDYLHTGWPSSQGGWLSCENCNTENLILTTPTYSATNGSSLFGCFANISGGGLFNFTKAKNNGDIQWISGQNFPTLNAQLPDSNNTYWSWKVLGGYGKVDKCNLLESPAFSKLYTGSDGTYTATMEVLASNLFGTPKSDDIWIEIEYVDTSGNYQTLSTFNVASTNITTSSAGWSTTTYGAKSYSKFKLSGSLTNLKGGTILTIKFFSCIASTTADNTDFFFVDPELQIS